MILALTCWAIPDLLGQIGFGDAPGAPIPWSASMPLGAGPEAVDSLDGYRYRINRGETHFVVERCSVGLPGPSTC
jgi:hypothetical protein